MYEKCYAIVRVYFTYRYASLYKTVTVTAISFPVFCPVAAHCSSCRLSFGVSLTSLAKINGSHSCRTLEGTLSSIISKYRSSHTHPSMAASVWLDLHPDSCDWCPKQLHTSTSLDRRKTVYVTRSQWIIPSLSKVNQVWSSVSLPGSCLPLTSVSCIATCVFTATLN